MTALQVVLAVLLTLLVAACVPGVSTPTPAAPLGRPASVPDKVIQQIPNVPSPPSGLIAGATPAAPGGYPVPGPSSIPISRPAPGVAYP